MSAHFREADLSLLTDLYELTMMQGYFFQKPEERGCFELFFRRIPYQNRCIVLAGTTRVCEQLVSLRFLPEHLEYLASTQIFRPEFLEYLRDFRFRGQVRGVPEGTPVFPFEPVVEVCGSLIEAQWVETLLLNSINYESLIATKASRVVHAARGKPVLEFGLRRAHGPAGGLYASRASIIGGVVSTSNTLAGFRYGAKVSGTMAHSWVMSFANEADSFASYGEVYPESSILLVDTYDTLNEGVPNAIETARKMIQKGGHVVGVRLDSGDPLELSRATRRMLDEAGLRDLKIFVSGDLDEKILEQLESANAPIDAYGVGTRLATGGEESSLGGVYKLSALYRYQTEGATHEEFPELQDQPGSGWSQEGVLKISDDPVKGTLPGRKEVVRIYQQGQILMDVICSREQLGELLARLEKGEPLELYGGRGFLEKITLREYDHSERLLVDIILRGQPVNVPEKLPEIAERAGTLYKMVPEMGLSLSSGVVITEEIYQERKKILDHIRSSSQY